ncbi:MAG: 16S rRNA (cytosine(1402)-N(4))-methyltransferase RsmH [Lachnospiraceae bacterium]|nr:16S rRNA (cytosine(1402)-N(4))-methyltransferase RsmH [Lachnospiraceae bacterium]
MEFSHEPVLIQETIENLNIKPDGIYVDGTLGGGGHSFKIVQKLKEGRLIGIDQDMDAIAAASRRLKIFADKVTIVHSNYANIRQVLAENGIDKVDGILLDIGVSSYQIDNPERGFSYMEDAPLDMRMDQTKPVSARTVVNTYSKEDLARIIRDYGEDSFANNIAKHIVAEREKAPIETTGRLKDIIEAAIPASVRKGQKGFAKKTFQALRIEVNSELDVLSSSIDDMIDLLNPGGRLAIITFHSLEDRIVKNAFKKAENPCTCPPNFPVCTCGAVPKGRIITKKPIIPTQEELDRNKRAASAKLRVFEKI